MKTPKRWTIAKADENANEAKRAAFFQTGAPDLRLEGQLTPRECATVLHGLRLIQCGGRIEGCAAADCEHFDDYKPLTDAEIDALAERINLGPAKATDATLADLIRKCEETMEGDSNDDEHDALFALIEHLKSNPAITAQSDPAVMNISTLARHSADLDVAESTAVEHLGEVASLLREAHGELTELEEDINHNGEGAAGCSYCEAIIEAHRIAREARGLPPRAVAFCAQCDTERPVNDDDPQHSECLICGEPSAAVPR